MRAILLGGTGAIGGATATLLSQSGWDVHVTGRNPSAMPAELTAGGVRFHRLERQDHRGVERLVGGGADLLVDLVAYTAKDVRSLLPSLSSVSNTVLISSRAVYVDHCGRDINGDIPPRFDDPIREDCPTVAPATEETDPFTREGYAPCKVAAELAGLDSGLPVTVIRASKVHGRWARNARTRGIVEQMLQGVPALELAAAETIDHLTAATNAAALISTIANQPGRRILNAADPDTPTAEEIVRMIATALAWNGKINHVPNGSDRGLHPWSTPMTLDVTAASGLGYRPCGSALQLIYEEIAWAQNSLSP